MRKKLLLGIGVGLTLLSLASCVNKGNNSTSPQTDVTPTTNQGTVLISTDELILQALKTKFSFPHGVTKSAVENEIRSNIQTNGTITFSNFDVSSGSRSVSVTATKGKQIKQMYVTIEISPAELSFSISKDLFEFNYGVSTSDIEKEIKKYVTTNGTITFSTISTAVGRQTIYVSASLGSKSMGQTVTVNINEAALSFSVSKDLFEFDYGVSASDIEKEIKKYVTTNGTITFSTISTAVGRQTIYVSASLGNKSMGQTVTVNINEVSLSLSVSKTTFDFMYGATESEIEAEIKKYVSTNGTISIVNIKTSIGTHEVTIFATSDNDSRFIKVTVNIIEGASISLSKTSFEFNNGLTIDEIKEEITKYITTNGTISFTGLDTKPGTYNCKVFAVKNNSSVYKDFTITILDTLIFKLSQETLEFLYGTTWAEIKSAVNNCIVTNGAYSYPDSIDASKVFSCGSYYVTITATYKGQTEEKKIYFNVNPDTSEIHLAPFSSYPVEMTTTSSSLSYTLAFTNNSGKQIKRMEVLVYIHVNGVVKAFSSLQYDETKTWTFKNGETTSVRYQQQYNSNFVSFDYSDKANGHYTGYDYNFWKSFTGTYTVSVFFQNVEYY